MHETLVSREELAKASDEKEYFRVMSDRRSLDYEKYISKGQKKLSKIDDYSSNSTNTLNVEQTVELLSSNTEVQAYL
jgi:UDP-glucose 4-epimerase